MSEQNLPAVQRITSVTEKITSNLPRLQKGNEIAMELLREIQATIIENDQQEAKVIEDLTKVRSVYQKVNQLRVEITEPLDDLKNFLMTFERPMDDKGKESRLLILFNCLLFDEICSCVILKFFA